MTLPPNQGQPTHSPGERSSLGPPGTVLVRVLRPCRVDGLARKPGAEFFVEERLAHHLGSCVPPFVERRPAGAPRAPLDWRAPGGRMLRAHLGRPRAPWRIVACLNIWNDLPALERTLPLWFPWVDALLVADGAYGSGEPSTDGLEEFLLELAQRWPEKPIAFPGGGPLSQRQKREALLQSGQPGDVMFIIDADEYCADAAQLRTLPDLDVGWVGIESPLYQRPYGQPRLIRWQEGLGYRGRHHWLYAGERLLATHQYGGLALHINTGLTLRNARGLGHSPERAQAKHGMARAQSRSEAAAVCLPGRSEGSDRAQGGREALRIVQLTHYDPGMVAYRLHNAINCTTPHASILGSAAARNPFRALMQFDTAADALALAQAVESADVVHSHLDWGILRGLLANEALEGQLSKLPALVIHHHGSLLRKMAGFFAYRDRELGALRLISNLELTKYGEGLHWLPNPVPVAEYVRLRQRVRATVSRETFRVAHSPSKRHLKGTEEFLGACDDLRAQGLTIEPVLIEGMGHKEALEAKAECDACFDSFWLGIQCSGIEAAAMGMPVIAGDPYVAAQYRAMLGYVPYTYANDGKELATAMRELHESAERRAAEAERVQRYVEEYHDEAAVALRYLDLLDAHMGWRQRLSIAPAPPALLQPAGPTLERREALPLEAR